nr:MAG TPA: hypothetical protein [Caudoviricetes sp.]
MAIHYLIQPVQGASTKEIIVICILSLQGRIH